MGQSISRCGQEQKQKTMRDKPHRNRRELTATAQQGWIEQGTTANAGHLRAGWSRFSFCLHSSSTQRCLPGAMTPRHGVRLRLRPAWAGHPLPCLMTRACSRHAPACNPIPQASIARQSSRPGGAAAGARGSCDRHAGPGPGVPQRRPLPGTWSQRAGITPVQAGHDRSSKGYRTCSRPAERT